MHPLLCTGHYGHLALRRFFFKFIHQLIKDALLKELILTTNDIILSDPWVNPSYAICCILEIKTHYIEYFS